MEEGGILLYSLVDNITEKVKAIDCNGVEILSSGKFFWRGWGKRGAIVIIILMRIVFFVLREADFIWKSEKHRDAVTHLDLHL